MFFVLSKLSFSVVSREYKLPGCFLIDVIISWLNYREDCKVCHYIINKVSEENDGTKYRIGDRFFPDLPSLLTFYKLHYLDTTPLVRPATRKLERVIAKHDFDGSVSFESYF